MSHPAAAPTAMPPHRPVSPASDEMPAQPAPAPGRPPAKRTATGLLLVLAALPSCAETVLPLAPRIASPPTAWPCFYGVETPDRENEVDGTEVLHPRYIHVPKVGRPLYPWLYAASVALPVRRVVIDYRPDVILSAWAFPDGIAAVASAKALGVPSVLRVMGSDINAFGLERSRRPQKA